MTNLAASVKLKSNLQHREKILPSERAWAYRIMMEALYHSGVKGESGIILKLILLILLKLCRCF